MCSDCLQTALAMKSLLRRALLTSTLAAEVESASTGQTSGASTTDLPKSGRLGSVKCARLARVRVSVGDGRGRRAFASKKNVMIQLVLFWSNFIRTGGI